MRFRKRGYVVVTRPRRMTRIMYVVVRMTGFLVVFGGRRVKSHLNSAVKSVNQLREQTTTQECMPPYSRTLQRANPGYTARELTDHLKITEAKFILTELKTLDNSVAAAKECDIPDANMCVLNFRNETIHTAHQLWNSSFNMGNKTGLKWTTLPHLQRTSARMRQRDFPNQLSSHTRTWTPKLRSLRSCCQRRRM